MTPRERLAKKIKDELGVDIDPSTWRRSYAGYWQRSSGCCSSSVKQANSTGRLLFFGPISDYLKKDVYLDVDGDMVYAEPKPKPVPKETAQ